MTFRLCKFGFLRRATFAKALRSKIEEELRSSKCQLFDFATLKLATNNFINAIGIWSHVYKGELADGRLIAVKWLNISSRASLEEMNKLVVLVSRLEHKNIMKLIGYCMKDEKAVLIVYDYMPFGTLDRYLFDPTKRQQLDWETRYSIIKGIAQGLYYLHEGLDIKIVHRDIKPSSILLNKNMNPRISNFSIAVTLETDQHEGICDCVAGTCGYIAPEHMKQGPYSTKLDIFSFGVTILEIITGRKCTEYQENETDFNLISYVLRHWKEGRTLEVIDPSFVNRCPIEDVVRCIHIGLVCSQYMPEERPSIGLVILMLNSNEIIVPSPDEPSYGYCNDKEEPTLSENEEGR